MLSVMCMPIGLVINVKTAIRRNNGASRPSATIVTPGFPLTVRMAKNLAIFATQSTTRTFARKTAFEIVIAAIVRTMSTMAQTAKSVRAAMLPIAGIDRPSITMLILNSNSVAVMKSWYAQLVMCPEPYRKRSMLTATAAIKQMTFTSASRVPTVSVAIPMCHGSTRSASITISVTFP
jgi:hypothetical protein